MSPLRQEVAAAVIVEAEPQARVQQEPVLPARAQALLAQVLPAQVEVEQPAVVLQRRAEPLVALRQALQAVRVELAVADLVYSPNPVALRRVDRPTTASRARQASTTIPRISRTRSCAR